MWQFTLSKVFADPVWYFYTFWFPQYLKAGHGFTMKEIGETAWIPFFTGGLGNLAGGFLCSWLIPLGLSPQIARRVGVLIFSALMVAAVPAAMVRSPILAIALISTATFGYCGGAGKCSCHPTGLVPQKCGRLDLGPCQYGLWFWGNVLQPDYRLACGPLFVSASVCIVRSHSNHNRHPDMAAPQVGSAECG